MLMHTEFKLKYLRLSLEESEGKSPLRHAESQFFWTLNPTDQLSITHPSNLFSRPVYGLIGMIIHSVED